MRNEPLKGRRGLLYNYSYAMLDLILLFRRQVLYDCCKLFASLTRDDLLGMALLWGVTYRRPFCRFVFVHSSSHHVSLFSSLHDRCPPRPYPNQSVSYPSLDVDLYA